jgi:hypothetical protein
MADLKYHDFFKQIMNKKIDCAAGGDVFRLQLHTSAYTPNEDHAVKADLSGEVANGNGYTTGGYAFTNTNNSLSDDDTGDKAIFDIAEDASWPASSITARYAILHDDTPTSPADPLVGLFDFGADKTTENGTFTVQFNANGIMTIA